MAAPGRRASRAAALVDGDVTGPALGDPIGPMAVGLTYPCRQPHASGSVRIRPPVVPLPAYVVVRIGAERSRPRVGGRGARQGDQVDGTVPASSNGPIVTTTT